MHRPFPRPKAPQRLQRLPSEPPAETTLNVTPQIVKGGITGFITVPMVLGLFSSLCGGDGGGDGGAEGTGSPASGRKATEVQPAESGGAAGDLTAAALP